MGRSGKITRPKGKLADRSDEVDAIFEARYPDYQYRFVEFFVEHVSDVSRAFKGDVQAMLVLAILGQAWFDACRVAAASGRSPEELPPERSGTSASRIADITGIPRETVRRKLAGLEERGWLLRNDDGSFRLAVADGKAVAKQDLSEIDCRARKRVARLFADLEALVDAHDPGAVERNGSRRD